MDSDNSAVHIARKEQTMSRYIDADALKERLMQNITLTNAIDKSFSEAPSIEIVRCKECKYWTNNIMQFDNNLVVAPCKQWLQYTRMNGYCHNGERKESE